MSDDPLYKKELLRLAADATGAGRLAAPDASAEASIGSTAHWKIATPA